MFDGTCRPIQWNQQDIEIVDHHEVVLSGVPAGVQADGYAGVGAASRLVAFLGLGAIGDNSYGDASFLSFYNFICKPFVVKREDG